MRRNGTAGAILAGMLLLTACQNGTAAPAPTASGEHTAPAGETVLIVTSGDPVGRWGSTGDREVHLELSADGTLGGWDGCNGFGGRWSADDTGLVAFEEVFMTLVACEGVDQWLSGGRYAAPQGARIQILDEDLEEIGTLPRAD